MAEILRISKLDWCDGGGKKEEKGRRSEGILLSNGLIHHGTPTGSFPESFLKIRLDLAGIFRIYNCFCLFVCLFMDLFFVALIIIEYPQEVSLKIS